MQIWSISYTADKQKTKNRCWLQGKMNYNKSTSVAHFYDEDNVEIGKIKVKPEQIKADAEFTLWKYLIEIGVLEGEEECVEDLFARLNKELGIENFDKTRNDKSEKFDNTRNKHDNTSNKKSISTLQSQKPKIPTKVSSNEPIDLYDMLYTRDLSKKTKTWHDGALKYHPNLKLGEFHDGAGVLIMKKRMEEMEEGIVIMGPEILIEVCASRTEKQDKENEVIPSSAQTIKHPVSASVGYCILYTTDKHKKAKKWLDGRLDYDPTSRLAKFIDDESDNCFYKKVMRDGEIIVGAELQTGLYIIQIDHLIEEEGGVKVKKEIVQPQCKKIKSVVASGSVPLEGRSNEQLLSLLKSKMVQE